MSSRHSSKTKPLLAEGQLGTTSRSSSSSISSETSSQSSSTESNASEFPNGKCIWSTIWERDPTSEALKTLYTSLTIMGLLYMIISADLVMYIFSLDGSWDQQHGFENKNSFLALPELVSLTLGLPLVRVNTIFCIVLGIYGLLIVSDLIVGAMNGPDINRRTHPYPTSWKTDNTVCYHEMFSEPTRYGRLLRRPGNTLSNCVYLLASLCVLSSCLVTREQNTFWMADMLFGIMLFFLTIFSNLWHASNAEWVHYADLWAMDSCILFLIIRCGCFGFMHLLKMGNVDPSVANRVAGTICVFIYGGTILGLGKYQWGLFKKGWLNGGCPFSGRSRMIGKSDVWGQGQQPCHVTSVCAFAGLPVYYTILPTLVQVTLVGATGSIAAGNLAFRTLVIGWTYRMWERFVLDGCIFMNLLTVKNPTSFHTIGTSLLSPTAVMHFFTGLTLLTGYMHARSAQ